MGAVALLLGRLALDDAPPYLDCALALSDERV